MSNVNIIRLKNAFYIFLCKNLEDYVYFMLITFLPLLFSFLIIQCPSLGEDSFLLCLSLRQRLQRQLTRSDLDPESTGTL